MKKELNFLSLPDFFNKMLFINYNQKIKMSNFLHLKFFINDAFNVGNAIKAISILECIFPRKVLVVKIKVKKKKKVFHQKEKSNKKLFFITLNLTGFEYIELYRFFSKKPINSVNITNIENYPIINRKMKTFDFFQNLKFIPVNLDQSYVYLKNYHLN